MFREFNFSSLGAWTLFFYFFFFFLLSSARRSWMLRFFFSPFSSRCFTLEFEAIFFSVTFRAFLFTCVQREKRQVTFLYPWDTNVLEMSALMTSTTFLPFSVSFSRCLAFYFRGTKFFLCRSFHFQERRTAFQYAKSICLRVSYISFFF